MSSEMLGNLASCTTTVTMATCILKDVERVLKHKVRKAVFTEMFAWDLMSNFTRALVFSFFETRCNARSFFVGEKNWTAKNSNKSLHYYIAIKARLAFSPRLSINLPTTPKYTAKEKDG